MWKSTAGHIIGNSNPLSKKIIQENSNDPDEWDTDPDFVNTVTEKEQRWGSKTIQGSGRIDSVDIQKLRDEVKQDETKKKKEEELLLKESSRNVSTKSSALFYGNASIVSLIPIWLFWRIHQMEPLDFYVYFIVATLVSAYLLSFAYKNVKFVLKHKLAVKREEAITREINSKFSDKKFSKKDKDDRIASKKNEVAEFESTTFSIFYNNSLFLILLLVASFFVFKNFSPVFNYLLSMSVAAGITALFSTGTK